MVSYSTGLETIGHLNAALDADCVLILKNIRNLEFNLDIVLNKLNAFYQINTKEILKKKV